MIRVRGIRFRDDDDAFEYFRQEEIDEEAQAEREQREYDEARLHPALVGS